MVTPTQSFSILMPLLVKKSNHIPSLKMEVRDQVSNHEDMCRIVSDYFSNMFVGPSLTSLVDYEEDNVVITDE